MGHDELVEVDEHQVAEVVHVAVKAIVQRREEALGSVNTRRTTNQFKIIQSQMLVQVEKEHLGNTK